MILTKERIDEIAISSFDELQISIRPKDAIAACNLFLSRIREEQDRVRGVCLSYDGNPTLTSKSAELSIGELPLFTIPPAAPECNCNELVEALEEAYNQVKELCECNNHPYPLASFERYREALAKHKAMMEGK